MTKQKTIKTEFSLEGVGLHSGRKVKIRFIPGSENKGIVFQRVDKKALPIQINIHAISNANFATIIGTNGSSISTTEHLMAALLGLGIDNIFIEVGGPEIPILDGSASEFVTALMETGIKTLPADKEFVEVSEPINVHAEDRWVSIYPYDGLKITFSIDYPHPLIRQQSLSLDITPESFSKEIAYARTFGFKKDIDHFYSLGLAQGGSLDNAVVLDDKVVLNPSGLRVKDEFVRHKILDLLGDMALIGNPLRGHIIAHKSGHALHHKMIYSVMDKKDRWFLKNGRDIAYKPAHAASAA
jgi:UDP-3-O-[3-hydroxymyristoyl] N-acetylglucosamine deacetylase